MVKVVLGNVYSQVIGVLSPEVKKSLDETLSYTLKDAKYSKKFKAKKWDGRIRLFNRSQSFPTGLMSFVREIFENYKLDYTKEDQRVVPSQNMPNLRFVPPKNYEVRPYQEVTVDRALRYTRGILSVATGGGKTEIVVQLVSKIKTAPFIFYVLTKDLMEQAHSRLSSQLNEPIGMIGDGEVDIKNLNVCTIQTAVRSLRSGESDFKIDNYRFDDEDSWDEKVINSDEKNAQIKNLISSAKSIYFDETHHVASKTCREVMGASTNAFWRYGGSATPYREAGDGILIQAMFGAKIVDISASYLIDHGYLVPPYIFIETMGTETELVSYPSIYKKCVVENQELHHHVAETATHLVGLGRSVLVLVQQIAHGKYLEKLIPNSVLLTGSMPLKKRKVYFQQLREKKVMVLICTSLADEGIDLPSLGAALLPGGGASSTRINQRIGRTLRIDKNDLARDKSIVVIYNHNKVKYLSKHVRKVVKLLKKEPRFNILTSSGSTYILDDIDRVLDVPNRNLNIFEDPSL